MRLLCLLLLFALPALAQDAGRVDESTKAYQIHARFPKLAPLEVYAQSQIAAFKKDFQETTGGKGDRVPWTLDLDYSVPWKNARIMSVFFSGATYTGGAHPNPFLTSFILDQKSGKVLGLSDFYTDDYLEALSQYCRTELTKRDLMSEPAWIARGTEPVAASFAVAFPVEKGFRVVFPPYQVAPYVTGPVEVLVPFDILAPYRKSPFPLD